MSKDINIEYVTVQVPKVIEVDGKTYPVTAYNINIVREYEATKDESTLDHLNDFSFSF